MRFSPTAREPGAPMSEGRGRWLSSSVGIGSSSASVLLPGPQQVGRLPALLVQATSFTLSTDSDTHLFPRRLHRHMQK